VEDLDLRSHDFRLAQRQHSPRIEQLSVCERSGPPAYSPKSGGAARWHESSAMRWL
jgi:hypothetical protein